MRRACSSNGCRVCGETFGSGHELRAHARRHHAKKRPKNYGKKPTNLTWPLKCEQVRDLAAPTTRLVLLYWW